MNVRDLSIKCSLYAHFIASREWAREDVRIPQLLCVAPDIGQEKTDATSDASQTFAYVRVGDLDDHRGAPERARATCSYLVARRTGLQASKSAWLLAKIPLAPVDSCIEGHVNEQ
jgi:hypothetical protein